MKTNKKPYTLRSTEVIRQRINTNPDFQRPAVWSNSQKQLLVDTILREYDIPKLYWRRTGSRPETFDVVDGQQRLRTIWEFFDGNFKLPKNSDDIDGEKVASLAYLDLPDDLRMRFDNYALDVVILEDTDEDEVREMFLRLQNGTSLKAQEKRNAYTGAMRDFVCDLAKHAFFNSVGFNNSRFAYDHIAAQLVCLETHGGAANIKNADLNKMYENTTFDPKGNIARSVRRTLDVMSQAFPDITPELERYNVITLYCIVSELTRNYVIEEIKPFIHDWFISFESTRRDESAKPQDEADPEWVAYNSKTSHSTDAIDSIKYRMDFMLRNLLETFPSLSRKDGQRDFTYIQKLAIFRRDKGLCQLKLKCNGEKLTWNDWHCDQITPHSKGGKTTVLNGQVSCSSCNTSKGNSHE
jgi:hypothetical protein